MNHFHRRFRQPKKRQKTPRWLRDIRNHRESRWIERITITLTIIGLHA